MTLHPTPPDNVCTECGNVGLTLARDVTEYHRARFNGEFQFGMPLTTEPIIDPATGDSVRLICADCGAYFKPPENLT